jgi:chromosome segregation ATPase
MVPNIKSAFEEVFHRLDAMEAKWESKLEEVKSSLRDRDAEVDRRLSALEETEARVPAIPFELERRVVALERVCNASINTPERISTLEHHCIALSQSALVANNWGRELGERVGEVERRTDDLELIRLSEIRDERNDRVAALEDAEAVFGEWKP